MLALLLQDEWSEALSDPVVLGHMEALEVMVPTPLCKGKGIYLSSVLNRLGGSVLQTQKHSS